MTNTPTEGTSEPRSTDIALPRFVGGFFVVSAVFILFGGFLGQVNAGRSFDWAIFQTMLGTVIFWVGVVTLATAFVLVGVRSIAQQQVDILLRAERDRQAK